MDDDDDDSPIYHLPDDTLHLIFSYVPLRQVIICRTLSKFFHNLLTTPSFLSFLSANLPPLHLLAVRHYHHPFSLNFYNPDRDLWIQFPPYFLPFRSPHAVASSQGLLYFWVDSPNSSNSTPEKSLVSCNPVTRQFRVLPHLGSAWSRHGTLLVDSGNRVMILTELAALYFSGETNNNNTNNQWLKFSSNLPTKPRSPVLIGDRVLALCDVGSPLRSQWKLFCAPAPHAAASTAQTWSCLERSEWGDVFDILKRPRLLRGVGGDGSRRTTVLMVGGLKSSFSPDAPCSTILILQLDLRLMKWEEAGRMPPDMFDCFSKSSKFKVFGGGDRVCFSAKRVGKLALWDCSGGDEEEGEDLWRWIEDMPWNRKGLYRGFVYDGKLDAVP